MHLDIYKRELNIKTIGESRPDLVGTDRKSNWVVIEAKGRTGDFNRRNAEKEAEKGKKQAQALINIAGSKPFLCISLVSYFGKNSLEVFLQDPPVDENNNGYTLDISLDNYLLDYYKPIVDFLNFDYGNHEIIQIDRDRRYVIKKIAETDAWIGLDESVYNLLSQGGFPSATTIFSVLPSIPQPLDDLTSSATEFTQIIDNHSNRQVTIGGDGVYVRLGNIWTDESMFKSPEDRNSLTQ